MPLQNDQPIVSMPELADRMPLVPVALAASLIGMAFMEERVGSTYHYGFGMALDSAIIAVTLIQLVYLGSLRGWRWLDHPVLRFFGRISYSCTCITSS